MNETFHARLRQARKSQNITQVDAAAAVGISRAFLSDIENGNKDGSFRTIMALADFYGITLNQLQGRPDRSSAADTNDIAHNEEERTLLTLWRVINNEERHSLMVLLRARISPRLDAV